MGNDASRTLAQISRSQWTDYVSRFVPLEDKLIDAYNNPELKVERMSAVTDEATQASDNAQAVASRSLARYGLSAPTNDKSAELSKTTNIVDARNTNRAQMNERDKLLISGGLTSRGV